VFSCHSKLLHGGLREGGTWIAIPSQTPLLVWLRRRHFRNLAADFLHHLNSIHQSIQFTMETESEGHLPFLDLDICRRPDGSLGHTVYRMPTQINLYLNAKYYHRPSNKQTVLYSGAQGQSSLWLRQPAGRVGVPEGRFQTEWLQRPADHRALNCRPRLDQPDNKPNSVAFLPFVETVFNRINRVRHICGLAPHEII
jgi:hypothetical protein